jgi:hypothetical protein
MEFTRQQFGIFGVTAEGRAYDAAGTHYSYWDSREGDEILFEVLRDRTRIFVEDDGQYTHDEDLGDALYVADWFNGDEAAVDGLEFPFDFFEEVAA